MLVAEGGVCALVTNQKTPSCPDWWPQPHQLVDKPGPAPAAATAAPTAAPAATVAGPVAGPVAAARPARRGVPQTSAFDHRFDAKGVLKQEHQ